MISPAANMSGSRPHRTLHRARRVTS